MRNTIWSPCTAALLAAVLAVPALAAWPAGRFTPLYVEAAPYNGSLPHSISDGGGGLWVAFSDFAGSSDLEPFVSHVDANGDLAWPPVTADASVGDQGPTAIALDGQGGVFVSFNVYLAPYYVSLFVQRVGPTGALLWGPTGTTVVGAQEPLGTPELLADGSGGCFVAWVNSGSVIHAQHILANGQLDPAWPAEGLTLPSANASSGLRIAPAGYGACLLSYSRSSAYGAVLELVVARVLSNGTMDPAWPANGLALPAGGHEQEAQSLADGAGGLFLAWERYGDTAVYDICAQHVLANGTVDSRWPATGRVVCAAAGSQSDPRLASDLAGGIVVGWTDDRAGNGDVYAARVLADGSLDPAWPVNGRAVCTADSSQILRDVASDGRGGAGLLWADGRWHALKDGAVLAHVSSSGVLDPAYPVNGRQLALLPYGMSHANLVADGAGGYLACFSAGSGVQAMRVDRWGLAGAHPVITALSDTPNDEGGSVNVTFAPSWIDTMNTLPVSAYRLWREVPSASAVAKLTMGARAIAFDDECGSGADAAPGDLRTTTANGVTRWWEMWTAIAGHAYASYTVAVGTMCDATPTSSPRTHFMVEARAGDGVRAWVSPPDSCASVDNLAPAAPASAAGLFGAGSVSLHWRATTAADFARYSVHRGTSSGFTPTAANLVATVTDTSWTGSSSTPYWYRVRAVDVHGNEGASVAVLPTGSLDADSGELPPAFALEPPAPNPSRDAASLRFTLPHAARVSLAVHDAQGRVVRVIASGSRVAGTHALAWDGRDAAGRDAAPGLYFIRLTCDGRSATRRLLRLP
ncbi:MAG: T9SS type A sorting domain-containing protein [Candidatus Eisenbacteria bacterium]|uniref:T9SS type A sorting domain-containing protein n=1 Tax=Eiseniibacteriota bacterium TaxID=2212470 RepID=A0A933SC85_UNCEI|nr:T9SS type A sorting domain-containing protein [Candidatus Eisenbacteria bacterium]